MPSSESGVTVAVAGATGAVGREMLRLLEHTSMPLSSVRVLASARSEGRRLPFRGRELVVSRLCETSFDGVDLAFFSAGADRSKQFAPMAVARGALVVDNSSAFRMDPQVPLVVPEVNAAACEAHRGIIANPNCSTIQLVLPLKVLDNDPGLERVIVSTYQSASGAGQAGVDELLAQTRSLLAGERPDATVFPHPLGFEVLPHIGGFLPNGYTSEELKMTNETRKILGRPTLRVSATCVRVPVLRGHSESVTVELAGDVSLDGVRERWAEVPNLRVLDDPARNNYPLSQVAERRTETFVGRLRRDLDEPCTLHFWVVSDNLLKGAAFNAMQIAEHVADQSLWR